MIKSVINSISSREDTSSHTRVSHIQIFPADYSAHRNAIFILLQEGSGRIKIKSANEINHQAETHTY